jgi:GGDEF domain-containing protein
MRGPVWWLRRVRWKASTFHPERGARWLVPLPADVVVFHLDIIQLIQFNDEHGHRTGDALLVEIASNLAAAAAPWPAYRYQGDEFLVIARLAEAAIHSTFASGLQQALERPVTVPDGTGDEALRAIKARATVVRPATTIGMKGVQRQIEAAVGRVGGGT